MRKWRRESEVNRRGPAGAPTILTSNIWTTALSGYICHQEGTLYGQETQSIQCRFQVPSGARSSPNAVNTVQISSSVWRLKQPKGSIHSPSFLWQPENDDLFAPTGVCHQPQAGGTADEKDGVESGLSLSPNHSSENRRGSIGGGV